MDPVIAIVSTVDTKREETEFLVSEVRRWGCEPKVVDVGLRSGPREEALSDVPASVVASAAGERLADLREHARRDHAMAAMATGAGTILSLWHHQDRLHGVLGVGGNQGTAVTGAAMRSLPFGLPKHVVSTVASGNLRGFIGDADITVSFSVGDLLGGPNQITGTVLRQAAAAVVGMARAGSYEAPRGKRVVAVTAFGNTHAAVTTAIERLRASGLEVVPFHASGASGSAMERLIREGLFDGVLDITTHEVLAELYPDDIYTPVREGRLTAAGERGIPQVVLPGGLEYHCFAAAETIPEPLRERAIHYHNPNNTNVRASAEELVHVARTMAKRLGAATGPVTVVLPELGWSQVGSPGGPLHDPAANAAFVDEFVALAPENVRIERRALTINDPELGTLAAEELIRLLARQ
ncbi:Tm-1-like ATP-binding domain-containing protein [Amycolatopsis acidiphila]|uniref:UPF0261 family protein n=1 Tax=Amycolatopsis acidiphila TaxID=715473 RepID=A0A558ALH4_9PSEU|nr:Tm-1-like ATP-binding domain-containing protein [Amycolatopsis acidiphila]TVT25100.1 UPF0261 family protein [Amycolatopsis acidiphila]UIJ57387.1 Tm-1-like ATP-binding domain-containing protein [Amycolatopsis acidiphila]GHG84493.1 hypothetical protein GCM10017788_56530 [Amycolatopsis acidiphila]